MILHGLRALKFSLFVNAKISHWICHILRLPNPAINYLTGLIYHLSKTNNEKQFPVIRLLKVNYYHYSQVEIMKTVSVINVTIMFRLNFYCCRYLDIHEHFVLKDRNGSVLTFLMTKFDLLLK